MNLTTRELIKLVEDHDAKAVEFEKNFEKNIEKNIVRSTGLNRSELEEYNISSIIVLLGLIKLKQATVDEVLEHYVNSLHK